MSGTSPAHLADSGRRSIAGLHSRRSSTRAGRSRSAAWRSEEHTSELQSRENLVCRLLLEKKNRNILCSRFNLIRAIPLILSIMIYHVYLLIILALLFFVLVIGNILTSHVSLIKHFAHNRE